MPAEGNVGLAFGLVIGAGLATTIGAAFVLFGKICKPRILAVSLSFAAGVMLYVSFSEIYSRKSYAGFIEAGFSEDAAFRNSTFCFFGGIAMVYVLDGIVRLITMMAVWLKKKDMEKMPGVQSLKRLLSRKSLAANPSEQASQCDPEVGQTPSQPCTPTPVDMPRKSSSLEQRRSSSACRSTEVAAAQSIQGVHQEDNTPLSAVKQHVDELVQQVQDAICDPLPEAEAAAVAERAVAEDGVVDSTAGPLPLPRDPNVIAILQEDHHQYALKKMGLLTALAIAVHNLPEGSATFVAALADTSLGVTLAVAIAIHNIPEGICVALPIYYATGSKLKGFMWGTLSGLTEPLGGLLAFFILYNADALAYAIVFGFVGGMMVCISLKELLPTALRYDNNHGLVVLWLIAGMVVMALSLILFTL